MRTGIHEGGRGSVSKPWSSLRLLGGLLASAVARRRGAAAAVGTTAAATPTGEGREKALVAMARTAARMLQEHRVVSLVLVGLDDLSEIEEVFGRAAAVQVQNAALARLRVLAGAAGVVCRTGSTRFAVLVPGLPGERAVLAANAAFGQGAIELGWHGQEIVVAASCAARTLGDAAMLEEVHEDLCDELALPLSHRPTVVDERHTRAERPACRPLVLPERAPMAYATIPATVPMGLS